MREPWGGPFGGLTSQPALSFNGTNETIIFASGKIVVALTNAPGVTNYCYNTNIYPNMLTNVQVKWFYTNDADDISGFDYSSPAVGSDGTVYVDAGDATITALNGADGTLKWISPRIVAAGYSSYAESGSGPAIGPDGTIYHSVNLGICAIDPLTGSNKWVIPVPFDGENFNGLFIDSVVVGYNDRVYAKVDNFVPVGSATNLLLCLNGADGTTNWTAPLSLEGDSGAAEGAIALASDGEIYVGDEDGTVYSFCPNGMLNWSYPTYNLTLTAPMIGTDGTVYFAGCSAYSSPLLYAFQGPAPADCQGWPEDRRNNRRNGSVTPASLSSSLAHLSDPTMRTNGFQFTINPPMGPTGVLSNDLASVCSSANLIQWGEVGEVALTNGPHYCPGIERAGRENVQCLWDSGAGDGV